MLGDCSLHIVMDAMRGRDGGRGPWSWSYREQTASSSYSTSGTVSTGHTSNGSPLPWISILESIPFGVEEMEDVDELLRKVKEKETANEKKMEHIKILAKEFFGAPPAKCSIEGGDMSVLERWLTELGVAWVLHVTDGAPAREHLEGTLDARSWIPALAEIVDIFCLVTSLSPGHGHGSVEEEKHPKESVEQELVPFDSVNFTYLAMLKVLAFIDFVDAPNLSITVDDDTTIHPVKLHTLLRVHDALSNAKIRLSKSSNLPTTSERVAMMRSEMFGVLLSKEGKAGEAIWSAMEEIRSRILESIEDGDNSYGSQIPQGSSGIHKTTESVISYIRFLQTKYSSVAPIVSEAARLGKFVPHVGNIPPLTSLVLKMASCVQEKLFNKSEKFPDQSLRFLFLINNLSFIGDQLHGTPYFPGYYNSALTGRVDGYMKSYIQVSWAPVLSCLFTPTPRCFGKPHSALPKFEAEFQKTYTTQKLWKVPDPKLRKMLREVIMEEIIPGYTKYIRDNNVTTPKFTSRNLKEMLQELFEG